MKLFNKIKISAPIDNRIGLSTADINIVFDGDSLTKGSGATNTQNYPIYIKNKLQILCNTLTFNSFGVSGQSTIDMLADASTQIDPLVDNAKTNIIVAWDDVNAILNDGRTAQQNFDDFETYFSERKTAGFNIGILILGYYPRLKLDDTYNQPTWNDTLFDIQEAYRELERNAVNPSWDVLVDLTIHPQLGGDRGQYLNTTLFNDSVHLTSSGYDAVGEWVLHNGILKNFK